MLRQERGDSKKQEIEDYQQNFSRSTMKIIQFRCLFFAKSIGAVLNFPNKSIEYNKNIKVKNILSCTYRKMCKIKIKK